MALSHASDWKLGANVQVKIVIPKCDKYPNSLHQIGITEIYKSSVLGEENCRQQQLSGNTLSQKPNKKRGAREQTEVCKSGVKNLVKKASTPKKCKFCLKEFTSLAKRILHMKTHNAGARPFQCDICSSLFKSASSRNIHTSIHNRVKKFKCQNCDKSFGFKVHLKQHVRVHKKVKLFGCKSCDKKFRLQADLALHASTHARKNNTCVKFDQMILELGSISDMLEEYLNE